MRALRALPTLLRIGVAETVAYRAEFVVWMLTSTMPLVMLALWTAVAREAPIPGFGAEAFTTYYLATLVVRHVTGNWVVWELNYEIRQGTLSMRLLRPMHPLFALGAQHLAAVPLRAAVAVPIALLALVLRAGESVPTDLGLLTLFAASLALAWVLNFLVMALIGLVALYTEQSLSIFDVFLGVYGVFSGYLMPLELLPPSMRELARDLPFRYMLGFPVELIAGRLPLTAALTALAAQFAYVVFFFVLTALVWRRALRRFEAFGG